MSLTNTQALIVLRETITDSSFIQHFFQSWFEHFPQIRDLFPTDLSYQHQAFREALWWIVDQVIEQSPEQLVSFLAQLGRDHHKFSLTPQQYHDFMTVFLQTLSDHLSPDCSIDVTHSAQALLNLVTGVMSGTHQPDQKQRIWIGTVTHYLRVGGDIGLIRLSLDHPLDYRPGQYVKVEVPQCPGMWRYYSPAMPVDSSQALEFHIKSVANGLVSNAIVESTAIGDQWKISSPYGGLHVNRRGQDILMVAGSTGLAPLRAILLWMTQWINNPHVHLFFGSRYPCQLYDLPLLGQLLTYNSWLTVIPVCEYTHDPSWARQYPTIPIPAGIESYRIGQLPTVVCEYDVWDHHQILLCGNPLMVKTLHHQLLHQGVSPHTIQYDPLSS